METITDYGRQLWVIGSPIAHTLSPPIHNAAFEAAGLPHRYFALEVQTDELETFLNVFEELDGLGANLTLPLKESVREYVGCESESVARTGAANTLYWNDDGELALENTDVHGFKQLLEPVHERIDGGSVILLGAGGAARACLLGLKELNADTVFLWNRTTEKARALAERFSGMSIKVLSDTQLDKETPEAGVVVNSTSLGLEAGDPSPYPVERISDRMIGVDLIYGRRTQFLSDFERRGQDAIDGLTMLVQQAARGWELWTGEQPDETAMEAAVKERTDG